MAAAAAAAGTKAAYFCYGRMNPPTIGHKKLIQTTMDMAARAGADAFVYVTRTQNRLKDPLDPETKAAYVRKMVPAGTKVRIVGPASEAVAELNREGYDPIYMVVGSDRMDAFDWVKGVTLKSGGVRDPDGEGVEGVKATNVRLGALGLLGKTRANVVSRLDPALHDDIDDIIAKIVEGLDREKVLKAAKKEEEAAGAGAAAAATPSRAPRSKSRGSKGGGTRRRRRRGGRT